MVDSDLNKKPAVTKTDACKILAETPRMNGFHFYAAFGIYVEETASSLCEFAEILRTIDAGSIRFHFPRGDFQRWIRETIGDKDLADRIDALKPTEDIENLRSMLVKTVNARIVELRSYLSSSYSNP